MISLIKASFAAPYRLIAQSIEATVTALSPFAILFAGVCIVLSAYMVRIYLKEQETGGSIPPGGPL